jgi:hypothetical protein
VGSVLGPVRFLLPVCRRAGGIISEHLLTVHLVIKVIIIFADFSLRGWKAAENMDPYTPLTDYGQSLLFEKMGISPHLQQEQCRGNTAMFNQTVWTDGKELFLLAVYFQEIILSVVCCLFL